MGEGGTATETTARNPLDAAAVRDRATGRSGRPITPSEARSAGLDAPRNPLDKRTVQRRNSRQVPVRYASPALPEITDDESVIVSRSSLVHGVSTGESVKHDRQTRESPTRLLGLPVEDRRRLELGEDILIPAEVVREHVDFLTGYVQRWNSLASQDAPGGPGNGNMLDHVLQNPAFYADKVLLDRLSVIKSGNVRGVVDASDIRQFLTVSDSWGETELAMERFTLMAEMGLGMETTINHKIYNRQSDDSLHHRQTIRDEDLDMLRSMTKTGISNSLTAIGAIGYFLGGRGKTEYDFRYRAEIVKALQKPPAAGGMSVEDRAVLFAFTGVELENFNATGNVAEPLNGSTTHAQDVEVAVTQAYNARKNLFVTLGLGETPTSGWFTKFRDLDRTRDIRTLHEFIYADAQGYERGQGGRRPEGTQFVADVRVMREYSRLLREAPPPPPLTSTTALELQRLQFMGEALTIVRNRFAQDRVEVEMRQKEEKRDEESLQALDEKRTAMDSGEFRSSRIEAQRKRGESAKTAREAAEARRTKMFDEEGSIGKADTKAQALASKLNRLGVDTTGDIQAAFLARQGQIQLDINTQVGVLNGLLNNQRIEQQAALGAARLNYNAMVAGLPAGVRNIPPFDGAIGEKDAVAERWKPMIEPVQAEIARFNQEIITLRERNEEYRSAVDDQFGAVLSLAYADRERDKLANALDARTRLTAAVVTLPGAAAAVALLPGDITDRSAQVLVDALRTAVPPVGADDAERLRWVLQAKAQVQLDNAPLPTYQQNAVDRLGTLPPPNNFSRDVLTIRDPNEVITVLSELYEAGGLPTDPNLPIGLGNPALPALAPNVALDRARAEVLAARLGVSRQLRELTDSRLGAEIDNYTATERNAQEQSTNLENLEIPKAQVDVAGAVLRRVADGSLLSDARSIADIPRAGPNTPEDRLVNDLGNVGVINAADTRITQAERDSGLQQGVLEWYAFLYPGYQDATNRQELFEGFRQDLPPQRLADIIYTELGMTGIARTNPNFVRLVLTRFRNRSRVAGTRPTQAEMIRVVRASTANIRSAGAAV
jgi:hypothetical protein